MADDARNGILRYDKKAVIFSKSVGGRGVSHGHAMETFQPASNLILVLAMTLRVIKSALAGAIP